MRPADAMRIALLAAIWGASFIFLRVAAPPLGPIAIAEARVLLAGVVLVIWLRLAGVELAWRVHWRLYLLVGVLNSAAPFALHAFGALYLPASYLVVLNATSPLFGAVLSAAWLDEPFTARTALGLAAGIGGVALLVGLGPVHATPMVGWAILASASAAACYALASAYMKRRAAGVNAAAVATGSQIVASLALIPLLPAVPPVAWPSAIEWLAVLALGIVCTGIAFRLYFSLIVDIGPTRALTVTFLLPLFGMLWGALFLAEPITPIMVAGCGLVLAGTALILGRPMARQTAAAARST